MLRLKLTRKQLSKQNKINGVKKRKQKELLSARLRSRIKQKSRKNKRRKKDLKKRSTGLASEEDNSKKLLHLTRKTRLRPKNQKEIHNLGKARYLLPATKVRNKTQRTFLILMKKSRSQLQFQLRLRRKLRMSLSKQPVAKNLHQSPKNHLSSTSRV